MRIKITHHDLKEGRLFKNTFHEVHVTVDFTHEERQIVRQRGLSQTKIMDRRPADARQDDPDEWFELRMDHLFERKPDRFRCKTPSEAKIYEEDLVEALRMVKLWLSDNAEQGIGRIIEL